MKTSIRLRPLLLSSISFLIAALAFSQSPDLKIGDTYAGGIVFYLDGNGGGLVAAPEDQGKDVAWYNGNYVETGAIAMGIGDGESDTATIVAMQGKGDYAASLCANLDIGGFKDWYLPSTEELSLIYLNLFKHNISGFVLGFYWTSTENDLHFASALNFNNGGIVMKVKMLKMNVRAIRAFQFQ
jgi:hypothetical protein